MKINPERRRQLLSRFMPYKRTGIYVRAKDPEDGCWGAHDLAELDRASLLEWLRTEPGRAEQVVLVLLEHPQEPDAAPVYRVKETP